MKKIAFVAVVCAFVASPVLADMMVKIHDGVGNTSGGEFLVEVLEDSIGNYGKGETISTFCIELGEYLSLEGTYYVTLSDAAVKGGQPVSDPLDAQSKSIYNYWLDSLGHTAANADLVQNALWAQEESGAANSLNSLVYGAGGVKVMNLWNDAAHTSYAQDLLVRVPVPGAVLLAGLGLVAAGRKLRRFV